MLHQHILLIGFSLSLLYVVMTFLRIRNQANNAEERVLSVLFGVSLFGSVLSGIGLHSVVSGFTGLLLTAQEWLVIVGSLLTCRHINDRHRRKQCSTTNL